jgi:hypothetical protein
MSQPPAKKARPSNMCGGEEGEGGCEPKGPMGEAAGASLESGSSGGDSSDDSMCEWCV